MLFTVILSVIIVWKTLKNRLIVSYAMCKKTILEPRKGTLEEIRRDQIK